ncbi:MAG: phosphate/phosphite/phosphonate ABC transporter substrate-binding protein [Nitrospirota bacterium]|nr:phosphate/phosphite/phosphonate ABC transporter substrate-binding protein [Nitrospirota bacterium]
MIGRIVKAGLVTLVVVASLGWSRPETAAAEIKLGLLPRLSAMEMTAMFTPLAEYLSKETGEKVSLIVPKDFDAFKALVSSGHVDMGFANPLIYVQLKKDDPSLDPLGLASEKSGTKFRGIIIIRKDSGIEKVQDLKGKKIIFVEQDSAAGHIFQMLTLSKAGLDVKNDFTKLPFAKKHSNVAMAVFNKAADAGGIREDDLEKMKDVVDLAQIKVVAYTDYYPNWPLFSTKKMSKASADKVKAALLKLKPNSPEAKQAAGPAKITGFAPVVDKDYDLLRQAAKIAGAY